MDIANASAEFQALHHAATPLLLPNAWDYASAAALAAEGFRAVGTTSLGVAAAHGLPDGENRTRVQTLSLARRLSRLACLVTVDIEAGFSENPTDVASLAAELVSGGAVGVNLEDGRPAGTLADPGVSSELIAAIKASVPELFVNARIDTYWLGVDPNPAATLARAERYLTAGADGIFVPGVADERDVRALVDGIPAPLNVLFRPGEHSIARLAELGVRRISTGSLLFRVGLSAVVTAARAIRDGAPLAVEPPGYHDVQRMTTDH
ncbi:MAG: isocitrate lyase/phosphoenolpyruvate mutase family protein [Kutzneria sp.]|nr:isocitrate lyase/phosphoenolpyruvate mutase family protein [Kutzneria sp.]MBV9847747.1 isocitrate lyase/phosphoenolpyruvate mutase family protein [Kutzneria sp.]